MKRAWMAAAVAAGAVALAAAYAAGPGGKGKTEGKWEYCELQCSITLVGPGVGGMGAAMPGPGGAGPGMLPPGGPGGGPPRGVPGPGGRVVARGALRWVSAGGVLEADDWADLAKKMKARAAAAAPADAQRMRVLDHLGAQSWELVSLSQSALGNATALVWTFRRKAS